MQRRTGGPLSRLLGSLSLVPVDHIRYPTENGDRFESEYIDVIWLNRSSRRTGEKASRVCWYLASRFGLR